MKISEKLIFVFINSVVTKEDEQLHLSCFSCNPSNSICSLCLQHHMKNIALNSLPGKYRKIGGPVTKKG